MKILILTAAYGEGHNSAARGIRAALSRVAPHVETECHDLFAETFTRLNDWIRKSYLGLINRWPHSWGYVYNWLDRKKDFYGDFRWFPQLQRNLQALLDRFAPDIVVSVFPAYPYL